MKFRVSKTSNYDEKPFEDERLIFEKYNLIDVRTFGSPDEFNKRLSKEEGLWESEGINHKINEKGYIQREYKDRLSGWFIEINTLEELIELYSKYGDLIVTKNYGNELIKEIEIYDDWRE